MVSKITVYHILCNRGPHIGSCQINPRGAEGAANRRTPRKLTSALAYPYTLCRVKKLSADVGIFLSSVQYVKATSRCSYNWRSIIVAIFSLPAIIQDLPDALLGNAKHFSQCRYRLAFFVSCADFSIASTFAERAIRDGRLRQKSVVI